MEILNALIGGFVIKIYNSVKSLVRIEFVFYRIQSLPYINDLKTCIKFRRL